MQEEIAQSEILDLEKKRLLELLGPGYSLEGYAEVYIYKLGVIQKRSVIGRMRNVTQRRKVARVDLRFDSYRWVEVCDKEVYEKMKQFGEEIGFNKLVRAWPGAAEENAQLIQQEQAKKKPKKMKEVVKESEQLRPRYEQLGKQ
jgi:hypothetical protein